MKKELITMDEIQEKSTSRESGISFYLNRMEIEYSTEIVMVQERDIKPRKVQEADLDRPVPPRESSRDSNVTTDVASGLALLLAVIAFFFSVFAVFQAVSTRRAIEGLQQPQSAAPNTQSGGGGTNRLAEPVSRPILPQVAPYRYERVRPGEYTQPAYGGAGQVELLSATRSDVSSNVVNIEMRIRRLPEPLRGNGEIDLAQTTSLNTRTNESYPVLNDRDPSVVYLTNLRPGQSTQARIAVRVPEGLDRIDLGIPGTRTFRNVPISTGNS